MKCRIIVVLALMFSLSPLALAQNFVMEVTPFFSYTLSEGTNVNIADIPGGGTGNRITPVSGWSWGFQADVLASEIFAMGFQYAAQSSKMELGLVGAPKVEITDMKVRNYHAMFTLNLGDDDATTKPFIFLGLGATQYSPDDIMGSSVDSNSKFSTTWGGGVKWYGTEHIGVRMGIRWTPTYINSGS